MKEENYNFDLWSEELSKSITNWVNTTMADLQNELRHLSEPLGDLSQISSEGIQSVLVNFTSNLKETITELSEDFLDTIEDALDAIEDVIDDIEEASEEKRGKLKLV